ncbi:MAG: hypothetical protein M3Y82_09195 [Verrucomicrobiota bacterium]|nr:hypothetical protein [Verrucomicrobiota bacterium]
MRMFVKAEVFHSITSDEDVAKLREAVGKQIKKITDSGKMEAGWVCAGVRMPMFIVNVESASELMGLLGNIFVDNFKIEIHPIISLEELGKYFAANPVGK